MPVYNFAYLPFLFFADSPASEKRRQKIGKRTAECPVDEGAGFLALAVFFRHTGRDDCLFVFHKAFVDQTLDHGIRGGFFPPQLLQTHLREDSGSHRLIVPENHHEPVITVAQCQLHISVHLPSAAICLW